MILVIDTTKFGKVEFSLEYQRRKIKQSFPVRPQVSDKILNFLDDFLKASKVFHLKSDIKKIVIYKGQGSFIGLRIAAAIAQALSFAWSVPLTIQTKIDEKRIKTF